MRCKIQLLIMMSIIDQLSNFRAALILIHVFDFSVIYWTEKLYIGIQVLLESLNRCSCEAKEHWAVPFTLPSTFLSWFINNPIIA